jgi:HK97 family phage portal protein
MSLIGQALGITRRSIEKPAEPLTSANLVAALTGAAKTATGKVVSTEGALRATAVYACVRVITQAVATLPLILYRRLPGGGKERDPSHPLYTLLHDLPNPYLTSLELRENLTGHVALWGDAYAEIEWSGAGRPLALWPLRPDRMAPRLTDGGQLVYETRLPNGETKMLAAWQVWHIRGWGTDSLHGLSPVGVAREAVGTALAVEEYCGRFFANDSRPGGVLKHPAKLTKDGAEKLRSSWEAAHSGLEQAHRVAVLEEGVEWQALGIPPKDAQFLEARQFQTEEIARLYQVPPHKIGDLTRATFSNIEHQEREFVDDTLMPWLVRFEQTIKRDLLTEQERATWFVEHLVAGRLRGDTATRNQAYATGRQWGWLSADDVRELENMNPLPDGQGKIYMMPLNMVPAGSPAPASSAAAGGEGRMLLPEIMRRPLGEETRGLARAGSSLRRMQIQHSYRRLIADAAARLLRREEADVMRQAERLLGQRDVLNLNAWLEEYYRTFPEHVARALLPVLLSLGDQIEPDAAVQIGASVATLTPGMEDFIRRYVAAAAERYASSSQGQLRAIIIEAQEAEQDPLAALQSRFAEWGEKRPDKLAMTHTVRAGAAIAKECWRRYGVRALLWHAHGTENCPFCAALDGRKVGIEEFFLAQGEDFQPEGAASPLRPRRQVGHAPAHLGCDCGIDPA